MLGALIADRHAVGLGVTGAGVDTVGAFDRQVHLVRAPVQRLLLDHGGELLGAEDLLVVPEVPCALEEVLVVAGVLGAIVRIVAGVLGAIVRIVAGVLGAIVRIVAGILGVIARVVAPVPVLGVLAAVLVPAVIAVLGVVVTRRGLLLRLLRGGLLGVRRFLSAATGDQGGREGHPGQRGQEPHAPARTQGTAWSGNRCGICTAGTGGRVRCRGGGHDVSFSVLALGWAERSAPCTGRPASVIPTTACVERIPQPVTRSAPLIHVSTDPSQEQT